MSNTRRVCGRVGSVTSVSASRPRLFLSHLDHDSRDASSSHISYPNYLHSELSLNQLQPDSAGAQM
jgi:hypothetical protein